MRLIDADLLKKNISKWLKSSGDPQETEMVGLDDIAISVIMEIEEQPTAYSVDKVVEELEIERKTAYNIYNSFNMNIDLGRIFGLGKAIEIVKQGGVVKKVVE